MSCYFFELFLCMFFWQVLVGFFLSPTVADCLVASPHLQPDTGTSSVVMAAFITLSNVFLKTRFCPEVVQALGAQLVQSYNPMEYLG